MDRKKYEQPIFETAEMEAQQMIAVSEGGVEAGGPGDWGWPDGEITI